MNEYGPLLPPGFLPIYEAMKKDALTKSRITEADKIKNYFDGNKEKADAFRLLFDMISDELLNEAKDSAAYVYYKNECKNPAFRFAADLSQLEQPQSALVGVPSGMLSAFRLKMFASFCDTANTPLMLVDSFNNTRALRQVWTGLQIKFDSTVLKEFDNEAGWQVGPQLIQVH